MTRLIKIDTKRLLSTRSTWGVLAAMVALITMSTLQTAMPSENGKLLWERQGYIVAVLNSQLFLLILGAKATTDDFRYGTIIPSVLITPDRRQVVLAKLTSLAMIGAAAAVAAVAVVVGGSWSQLGGGLEAMEMRSIAGFVLAGALFAPIGGAVGYLVRHQVGAIVGLIVWTMVSSEWFGELLGGIGDYLPSGVGSTLAAGVTSRSMLLGGVTLVAYMLLAAGTSAIAMQRRDVL